MKFSSLTLFLGFLLFAISIFSCGSDEEPAPPSTYEEIELENIAEQFSSLSESEMNVKDVHGLIWRVGDVIIFQTNATRYGKLQVLNIQASAGFSISAEIVTYSANGDEYAREENITIGLNTAFDLDEISPNGTEPDFQFSSPSSSEINLSPIDEAKFGQYTF